jgi:DNA-binding transcriptional LysR family regulator
MTELLETAELLAFTAIVQAKSLSGAAAKLGVPRATVGRRLARLEERLGVRLLRRTTRSLALTDAGEAFHRHAHIVLDALSQAEVSVRKVDDAIRGNLRVSLPPMGVGADLLTVISDFAQAHPEVRLQAHFATQHVDLLRDGYDVALRASTALEPGLVARTLARIRMIGVASPAYLAANGTPRSRADLRRHRCLMGFARGEVPETHWPLASGGKLQLEGYLFTNNVNLLREAVVRGLGIAFLPTLAVERELEQRTLVQVMPGVLETSATLALVYPEREFLPPQIRAFVDTIAAWAASERGLAPRVRFVAPAPPGSAKRAGKTPAPSARSRRATRS